jgi:hypothetical protein
MDAQERNVQALTVSGKHRRYRLIDIRMQPCAAASECGFNIAVAQYAKPISA